MKLSTKSGATIAAAAASLFLAGAVMTPAAHAAGEMGKCTGANACKGQSACKTAKNSCKGQNACKGQGFSQMSAADCKAAGGTMDKS